MKRSHWILMLLCCLVPVAGIAAVVLFQVPTSSVLFVGLLLMCPLLHLLMMGRMGHRHASPAAPAIHRHVPADHSQPAERARIASVEPRTGEASPVGPPR